MTVARGSLKVSTMRLQGHGVNGHDIEMKVDNDTFHMTMNGDTIMSVGAEGVSAASSTRDGGVERSIEENTRLSFTKDVTFNNGVKVDGPLVVSDVDLLQKLKELSVSVERLKMDMGYEGNVDA